MKALTDIEAIKDLELVSQEVGAQHDRFWAERWGWLTRAGEPDARGVARLRLGGKRRAKLPKFYDRHLRRLR